MTINGNGINGNGGGPTPPMVYPKREQCHYEVYVAPDASPITLTPLEHETIEQVKALQDGIAERVRAGDVWAWAIVVVIARWGQYSGMACVGQVTASSIEDFAHPDNPDCARLQDEAYQRLIESLARRFSTHVIQALSPNRAKDQ